MAFQTVSDELKNQTETNAKFSLTERRGKLFFSSSRSMRADRSQETEQRNVLAVVVVVSDETLLIAPHTTGVRRLLLLTSLFACFPFCI